VNVNAITTPKIGVHGKAEMNDTIAGNAYKAKVDALANAILNEYLAKQTETFTEIVKENAEKIKQEATKLSIIDELIQSQAKG